MPAYQITFRTLSGDLTGIVLNVLRDGALVSPSDTWPVQNGAGIKSVVIDE